MNIIASEWIAMTDGEKESALKYAAHLTKEKWSKGK